MERNACLRPVVLVILTLLFVPASAAVAQSDGWDWQLGIYGWLPELKAEGIDSSQTFGRKDLLSKVDFVLSGHLEARRNKVGLLFDAMYMELSDSETVNVPDLPPDSNLEVELEQLIMEIGGFYRPSGGDTGFDILLGARLIDMSDKLTLTPPVTTPVEPGQFPIVQEGSNDFWDAFVGVRYSSLFSERWGWSLRGDIATGDTDFTWNAVGSVGWRWGSERQHSVLGGWRYMDIDLDTGPDQNLQSVVYNGPFLAAIFGF